MTRDIVFNINIQTSLKHTTTILQLVNSSIVSPEGTLEEIIVSFES